MTETWKPVPSYEGLYEISDCGQVKTLRFNRVMSPSRNNAGYLQVTLFKSGVGRARMIHRLVAESFLENFTSGFEVNHKNGIKTENNRENLEMVTRSENLKHRCHVLGQKTYRAEGVNNYKARFTEQNVLDIRELRTAGLHSKEIARQYSVSQSAIEHIVRRRTWKHI